MTSMSFLKSKAFKEREENAREKVRQAAKQELLADLSRLFGDTTFTDVLFIVSNTEFRAHTVILRARAPNFCQHFLPRHASPISVETCIQINGLEAAEFEAFLRSVYTEDNFKDYDESSYPWRKQNILPSVDKINHVICGRGLKEDSANFQDDVDGISVQSHCHHAIQSGCTIVEDDDVRLTGPVYPVDMTPTCTHPNCGVENNNLIISCNDTVDMERSERADPSQNNDEEFATAIQSHGCISADVNDTLDGTDLGTLAVILHNTKQIDTLLDDQQSKVGINQNSNDLVNGFDSMAVQDETEYTCSQGGCDTMACKPASSCCFNGLSSGKGTDAVTCELITGNDNAVKTSLGTEQDLDLTADCMVLDKSSKSEVEGCCCNLGRDLLQLFISEIGTDVTFLIEGRKIKAHKAILCSRSNYFSAMLYGDWIEGKTTEIPLIGVNYNGFMTILKYIYGGTVQAKNNSAVLYDTLPLVDMYGLEGLKEIIVSTLKIDKCHMFHKPCPECLAGITECVEVSELFNLADLKNSCIKWMAKYFDRVLGTKGFATLPKQLQEETLAEIQRNFVRTSAIDVLNNCDKLSSCTPLVKWTEPVHVAVSNVQESCLLFISDNFFSMLDQRSFHEILKGVGWSVPILEKILSAVKRNFTIENCCDQLRAILKLKRIIHLRTQEEGEECFPEEVVDLVASLHNDCIKFIRSNLFKVTRSEGWKRLKIVTQREVKEGAVFSGLGDSRDRGRGKKSAPPSAQASSRPPTRSAPQRVGAESRSRGLGRGNTASGGNLNRSSQSERPSSARSYPSRAGPAATNKRPTSARPSSAQGGAMSGRGRMPSALNGVASEKKPLSTRASVVAGSSRLSHSFSRDPAKTTSAERSAAPGRGKMLSSKASLKAPSSHSSGQNASKTENTSKTRPATSNNKTRPGTFNNKRSSLVAQENNTKRPLYAPSSSGAIRKAPPVSRPPLPSGKSNSNMLDRNTKEKSLSVAGSRVQSKKGVPIQNSRQSRGKESNADVASCKPNKASTSTDSKGASARKELFKDTSKDVNTTTEAKSELVANIREEFQSTENDNSGITVPDETIISENVDNLPVGAQGNSEEAPTQSTSTESTQEASLLLNEGVDEDCGEPEFNDSLELD